jgi:hypothetical protein
MQISHHLVTGVELSFTAPIAITSAKEDYVIRIPGISCDRTVEHGHRARVIGGRGYGEVSLGRNVARGETVTHSLSDLALFSGVCGRPPSMRVVTRRSATIEVLYERAGGEAQVLVGRTTVRAPAGARGHALLKPAYGPP